MSDTNTDIKLKLDFDGGAPVPEPEPTPDPIDDPKADPIVEPELEPEPEPEPEPELEPDDSNKIDIDGVIYTINDDGNAVDDNGVVFKTKEELESEFEIVKDSTLDNIKKIINVDIKDEFGNLVEYEDTPDGIASYFSDVLEYRANEAANRAVNEQFEQFPILKDIVQHLKLNNGSLDNFQRKVDYNSIKLDEKNENQLLNIVVEAEKLRGRSADEAIKIANLFKADASLFDSAKQSLDFLKGEQKREQDRLDTLEKTSQLEEYKNQISYWGAYIDDDGKMKHINNPDSVYNIIKTGKLNIENREIVLPDHIKRTLGDGKIVSVPREDFFNYMYKPKVFEINGNKHTLTEYQYDHYVNMNKRTSHNDVLDAFKMFTNDNGLQLIEKNVKNAEVQKIKKLKVKQSSSASKAKQSKEPEGITRLRAIGT